MVQSDLESYQGLRNPIVLSSVMGACVMAQASIKLPKTIWGMCKSNMEQLEHHRHKIQINTNQYKELVPVGHLF